MTDTTKPPILRKSITLPAWMWAEVAEHRAEQAYGTEAETIRQLVISGLFNERPPNTRKARR